jgi:hypothetical protein
MGRCRQTGGSRQAPITPQIAMKPATLCFVFDPGFVRFAYIRLCVDLSVPLVLAEMAVFADEISTLLCEALHMSQLAERITY